MTDPFAGLEPVAFWRHFEALTSIPRATFEEEAVVAHVVAWAGERGYGTRRDGAGNLVVDVPATPGRERAPAVILQGHLDIVCERDPGSPYDPREGRIRVVRDGDCCAPTAPRSAPTTASRSRRCSRWSRTSAPRTGRSSC